MCKYKSKKYIAILLLMMAIFSGCENQITNYTINNTYKYRNVQEDKNYAPYDYGLQEDATVNYSFELFSGDDSDDKVPDFSLEMENISNAGKAVDENDIKSNEDAKSQFYKSQEYQNLLKYGEIIFKNNADTSDENEEDDESDNDADDNENEDDNNGETPGNDENDDGDETSVDESEEQQPEDVDKPENNEETGNNSESTEIVDKPDIKPENTDENVQQETPIEAPIEEVQEDKKDDEPITDVNTEDDKTDDTDIGEDGKEDGDNEELTVGGEDGEGAAGEPQFITLRYEGSLGEYIWGESVKFGGITIFAQKDDGTEEEVSDYFIDMNYPERRLAELLPEGKGTTSYRKTYDPGIYYATVSFAGLSIQVPYTLIIHYANIILSRYNECKNPEEHNARIWAEEHYGYREFLFCHDEECCVEYGVPGLTNMISYVVGVPLYYDYILTADDLINDEYYLKHYYNLSGENVDGEYHIFYEGVGTQKEDYTFMSSAYDMHVYISDLKEFAENPVW